jgi:hypothetical protein
MGQEHSKRTYICEYCQKEQKNISKLIHQKICKKKHNNQIKQKSENINANNSALISRGHTNINNNSINSLNSLNSLNNNTNKSNNNVNINRAYINTNININNNNINNNNKLSSIIQNKNNNENKGVAPYIQRTNNNITNNITNNNRNNNPTNTQNHTYNYKRINNGGNQFIVDSRYSKNTNQNSKISEQNNNINRINNNNINDTRRNNNSFVPVSASSITYNSPQNSNNNQNANSNINISHNAHNNNQFNISSFALSSNAMNNYEIMPENPNIRSKIDLTKNNSNNILSQLPENKIEDLSKLHEENKRCIICLSEYEFGDITIVLPCFHFFHKSCMITWYKRKACCPLCKLDIKSNM